MDDWNELLGLPYSEREVATGECPIHGAEHWHVSRMAGQFGDVTEYCQQCAKDQIEKRMVALRKELHVKGYNYSADGKRLDGYQEPITPNTLPREQEA